MSSPPNSRARQVRCTTKSEVQSRALPPKAKMTAEVWTGRSRPKVVHSRSRLRSGQASSEAMVTPIRNPTTPPEDGGDGEGTDRRLHHVEVLRRRVTGGRVCI